jgi:hypothetical protein
VRSSDEETSAPLVGAVVELTDLGRTAATDQDGRVVVLMPKSV